MTLDADKLTDAPCGICGKAEAEHCKYEPSVNIVELRARIHKLAADINRMELDATCHERKTDDPDC